MKRKEYLYSYIAVIVLSLVFIGISLGLKYTSAKMLPMIISGVVILMASVGLVGEITTRRKSGTTTALDTEDSGEAAGESWQQYALVGVWLAGFFLTIYVVGFLAAIFLFMLGYMKTHGTKWLTSTIFAIVTTTIVYGLFVALLKVYLYKGLLFS